VVALVVALAVVAAGVVIAVATRDDDDPPAADRTTTTTTSTPTGTDPTAPSSTEPTPPSTAGGEDAVGSGTTDGVVWTVLRATAPDPAGDVCMQVRTTPPLDPPPAPFCAPSFVPEEALATNAVVARIVTLPGGGSIVYGVVRGEDPELTLHDSDGGRTRYPVRNNAIAAAVPAGRSLTSITGVFRGVPVTCTPRPDAPSTAPAGDLSCAAT
jgi:hypothetical protein